MNGRRNHALLGLTGARQGVRYASAPGNAARAALNTFEAAALSGRRAAQAVLIVGGSVAVFGAELHQALGHELHHLAQHVDVGPFWLSRSMSRQWRSWWNLLRTG
jgi:hypothetical protein